MWFECKLQNIWSLPFLLSFQDKANKRWMLMAIDKRKKLLKQLRLVRYDAFEKVCEQLGITYTFPPEYYRRTTRRWLAKKAFCIKVANKWPGHCVHIFFLMVYNTCYLSWELWGESGQHSHLTVIFIMSVVWSQPPSAHMLRFSPPDSVIRV